MRSSLFGIKVLRYEGYQSIKVRRAASIKVLRYEERVNHLDGLELASDGEEPLLHDVCLPPHVVQGALN